MTRRSGYPLGVRHGSHQNTPTVAEVVRRAVEVCELEGDVDGLGAFLLRFEDRDEPVTALGEGRQREFFEQEGWVEGQDPDPSLVMAAAVATYLAFRRDEVTDDDDDLLRLAARAEFNGEPPPYVADWLALRGVQP
ncbi:MAG TPA: hypothetical protein VGO81_16845 [Solirubrobacteraceae bacterium]|nr:hypothetical protein [Solirubrobacteraceae bacterium]